MAANPINVLVIEDDLEYASLLHVIIGEVNPDLFQITHIDNLKDALSLLLQQNFDLVLLDLFLPDSTGMDTFFKVNSAIQEIPIVIITGHNDKSAAVRAVREGAQDYLIKDELNVNRLVRILLYAVERHRNLNTLKQQTLVDDLTGLLNRRGFLSLAEKQVRIAKRANWESILLFADLDNLKTINDRFGHSEGDQAIKTISAILKETFRTSDIIGRIGGDEFIVLAIKTSDENVSSITARLERNIKRYNQQIPDYELSLSFGVVHLHPKDDTSLEEAISEADKGLYLHKQRKMKE
ncbi:MAG: diguanylate cyclase [Anaerolineales bacterium]|nr:diguanylate cyclase [Anaerolineales bacterium]